MESFEIRNLTFSYPESDKEVLKNINLTVDRGEFIVLCGPSGCGKTTLLRQLKTVLAPYGKRSGEIFFEGKLLESISEEAQASGIGFVLQSPENQIVTDKVWHELAFGLEGLKLPTPVIRRRVAEMASFFGIQDLFERDTVSLSGGQKQLVNLASIMAMHPSVLILDEPASQLDPIAAADFLGIIGRINRELGTTVIMTEHRLEEVFPVCTRAVVMDNGSIICSLPPKEAGKYLKENNHPMFLEMPVPMRVYAGVPNSLECPVSVRDGARWLGEFSENHELRDVPEKEIHDNKNKPKVISAEELWFRYEKEGRDILKGVSLDVYEGEFLAILGSNGAGKSTLLSILCGINRAYRGKLFINGQNCTKGTEKTKVKPVLMPQNPKAMFLKKTVREDLFEVLKNKKADRKESEMLLADVAVKCRILGLMDRHPYDLSGGEQQRVALAKILLLKPQIIFMDEPTKGMDAAFKYEFAGIIKSLLKDNVTIVMVSHDIEFCASYAHRCALFFDGDIVVQEDKNVFFQGNTFYTTAANRMAASILPDAVTAEDIIYACGEDIEEDKNLYSDEEYTKWQEEAEEFIKKKDKDKEKLPLPRKIAGGIFLAFTIIFFIIIMKRSDLSVLINEMGVGAGNYMTYSYIGFILSLIMSMVMLNRTSEADRAWEKTKAEKRRLTKRTWAAVITCLIAVPVTIYIGTWLLNDRKYYFISLLIIIEAMIPFAAIFEGRKPHAREIAITSVLCAIAIASRAAFFMLPNFKPVMALVIISGAAFGGETGFLVGAMTMLVSNIIFGQGPWTPWQMFAMGIIGLIAGVLFRKGVIRKSRISLCMFGAFAAVVIYGGIMNPASVIMWQPDITVKKLAFSYVTGFPFDLVQAAATVIFLWLAARPMLEKLDRIKIKYGLMR